MKNYKEYIFEYLLVLTVLLLSITGFWEIYFGDNANPTPYQNFHVVTIFIWQFLLLYQLSLISKKEYSIHRKIGLSILFIGPLLFATTALLSVHSAHKGIVSGKGDILIVQNVMGVFELGLIILIAFILKNRRKLHGAFLLSTLLLFMGISLFFTLLSFVPQFEIKGPETFNRFGTAGATAQLTSLFIGLLFFLKNWRYGWPYLLAGSTFVFNQFINTLLVKQNLIQPLTKFVGSLNQLNTFFVSFIVFLILLTLTGIANKKQVAKLRQPSAD